MEEFIFFFIEILAELFFEYVLSFPVALFRRIVFRKKTLLQYWKDHKEKDAGVMILTGFAAFTALCIYNIYIRSHYHHPVQSFVA